MAAKSRQENLGLKYAPWMGDTGAYDHPEYVPPYPHYLQMVVDYVEAVLTTVKTGKEGDGDAAAAASPISVVFDMHNYQRWCPLGIGGTWSCLAHKVEFMRFLKARSNCL